MTAPSTDLPAWPFVGHVAHLKTVRALIARAKPGGGAVALVSAAAGLGKSRFLQEVALRESRSSVVIALGSPAPQTVPHSLRDQLAFALRDRDIHGIARQRPVLCTIDDLDAATDDDRAVVDELARASAGARVVVLATCANEWSGVGSSMRVGAVSIRLGPLDRSRSEILLKSLLAAFGETVDAQTAATIVRIAAGSPRYLYELVGRLADVRSGAAPLIPRSAEARLMELRSKLGSSAFSILREASVIGSEFREEWLGGLARRSHGDVVAAMQAGVDSGLLRELVPNRPSSFVFRDEAVRSALYETLVTARRKMLHRRIASELSAQACDDRLGALAARHWADAGDAGRAVDALQTAAARAAKRLDFGEAQELVRTAATLAERDTDAWWITQERLADYAAACGEYRGASKIRRRLAQHYRTIGREEEAFEHLFRLMHDYWYDGRLPMATATHNKLRKLGSVLSGDHRARAELGWAELCEAAGRRTEAMRILEALPADSLAEPATALQYRRQIASVGCRDRPIAETFVMFEDVTVAARDTGDPSNEYYNMLSAGTSAAEVGRAGEALAWLQRAQALLGQHANAAVGTARFLPLQFCELFILQGRFEEARDAIAGVGLGTRFGDYWEGLLSGFGVFIGMRLGDASLITPYFNPAHLHRVIRAGQAESAGILLWGYAEMMQSHGPHEELANALQRCTESDLIDPYFSIQLHCARFGSDNDVRVARKQLDVELARECNAVARAAAKLFDAFAAARQSRMRSATSAGRAAAAAYRSLEWPWMEALALETAGDRAEAANLYASCGAVRDVDRAAGNSRKERRAAFGASLTPREAEIRSLVLLGLKNREIANRLRLSERTVGHHLESIFSKSGVRARWQLAQETF